MGPGQGTIFTCSKATQEDRMEEQHEQGKWLARDATQCFAKQIQNEISVPNSPEGNIINQD